MNHTMKIAAIKSAVDPMASRCQLDNARRLQI